MIKIISAVIRTLQQIPFYFFILLKCVCVFVLIMVWANDLFFKILSDTPFSIYWIIPQMPFTPYILFFVLSVAYPNIQNLRPSLTGENIFEKLVMFLYRTDTPTNVLPSLHVYNSVLCFTVLYENKTCRKHRGLLFCVGTLSVLVILSTMFLKQHSIVDVIMALICNVICYVFVYWIPKKRREKSYDL